MFMFKRLKLNSAKSRLVEERLYEMVMDELDSGNIRKGIWGKALALSNGNDNQAKARYIELRVESLKDEVHVIQPILDSKDNSLDLIEEETSNVEKETYITKFFFVSFCIYSLALIIIVYSNSLEFGWFHWLCSILLIAWFSTASAMRVRGEHLSHFHPAMFFIILVMTVIFNLYNGSIFSWQHWLNSMLFSYFCATTRFINFK